MRMQTHTKDGDNDKHPNMRTSGYPLYLKYRPLGINRCVCKESLWSDLELITSVAGGPRSVVSLILCLS